MLASRNSISILTKVLVRLWWRISYCMFPTVSRIFFSNLSTKNFMTSRSYRLQNVLQFHRISNWFDLSWYIKIAPRFIAGWKVAGNYLDFSPTTLMVKARMLSLHQFYDLSQGDGDCVKTICIAELRSAMLLFSLFLQLKVPTSLWLVERSAIHFWHSLDGFAKDRGYKYTKQKKGDLMVAF